MVDLNKLLLNRNERYDDTRFNVNPLRAEAAYLEENKSYTMKDALKSVGKVIGIMTLMGACAAGGCELIKMERNITKIKATQAEKARTEKEYSTTTNNYSISQSTNDAPSVLIQKAIAARDYAYQLNQRQNKK